MRLWPRSIRWQMLAGLLLLEGAFDRAVCGAPDPPADQEVHVYQRRSATGSSGQSMALQAREAFVQNRPAGSGFLCG